MQLTNSLVILSGGQDSTTSLFWAKKYSSNIHAITFDYGQRHAIELEAASKVAKLANVPHELIRIPTVLKSTSPLIDQESQLEGYNSFEEMEAIIGNRVEKTFVPMRNALFLTIAANRAVCLNCSTIVIGVCQQDNANYPDCRQSFIDSAQAYINSALGYPNGHIRIHAPLMHMTKAQSIAFAIGLDAYRALAYTHTGYDGSYPPSFNDHATVLRARGFEEAGVPDPLIIRAYLEDKLAELPKTENYSLLTREYLEENKILYVP